MIYVRNDVFPTVSGGFVDEAILRMQAFRNFGAGDEGL